MKDSRDHQSESELDIDYYFRLLWHKKLYVILACALAVGAVYYLMSLFAPKFAASTEILIESNPPKTIELADFYTPEIDSDDYFQTQVELLKSRSIAREIIQSLGLQRYPEFIIPRLNEWASFKYQTLKKNFNLEYDQQELDYLGEVIYSEDRIIQGFQKHLAIIPVNRSKIITVSFKSVDPELATTIANLIAERYITIYLEKKAEITKDIATRLGSRLDDLKSRLQQSETELAAFERTNGLIDSDSKNSSLKESALALLINQAYEAQQDFESEQARLKTARSYIKTKDGEPADIPDSFLDASGRALKKEYTDARDELAVLRLQFQETYPDVERQKVLVDSLSQKIRSDIEKNINIIEGRVQSLRLRHKKAERELEIHRESIISDNDLKAEYNQLKSSVEQNRSLYETFSRRIREAQEAEGLGFVAARIIAPAIVPTVPTGPRKIFVFFTVIVVTSAFTSAIILLTDIFNRKIRYAEKFEKQSGLTYIGSVPHIKSSLSKEKIGDYLNLEDEKKEQPFYQAIRNITMRLYSRHMETDCRIYMVSSSLPDEGKSTVALNLANSFSKYKRTLLIDSDIRRPSISRSLGFKDAPGLTAITHGASLKSLIHKHAEGSRLYVLPAGQAVDEPVQFLMSESFERTLKNLSTKFHRIILDTPPVLAVNDALLLSRLVDNIVFVVRSNQTPAKAAKLAIDKLHFCREKFDGFILTDVKEKDYRHIDGYEEYKTYASYYDTQQS